MLFLVLFLFYSAYFMLRFSVEPGPQRANLCAVYAIFGVVLIPISFLAIRLANQYIHPVAFNRARAADGRLAVLHVLRLPGGDARAVRGALPVRAARQAARREAARAAGAAGMTNEEKYVAAAYLVVFAFVLVYLVIMALKLSRLEREVGELTELARKKARMIELLFWPALLAYGEAAVAYAGDARQPGLRRAARDLGRADRLAPADGAARRQAERAEGFPWTTWAGSLNLFVWLVVSVYLVWGCRTRYRLLGLAVMPLAVGAARLAWAGGGTGASRTAATRPCSSSSTSACSSSRSPRSRSRPRCRRSTSGRSGG